MTLFQRSTLPNAITVGRIVMAPLVGILLFVPTFTARFIAFILFLIAAFSDLWDGHLARKHGWISNFGKLVDPVADKLLMLMTFIPFYMLSHRTDDPHGTMVAIGQLPLWIVIVIFAREALVTVIRSILAKRGTVIAAGSSGKLKTVFQNIFAGTAIFWLALHSAAIHEGWVGMDSWRYWTYLHGFVFVTTLAIAVFLTVYSLIIYLWEWRRLMARPL